MGPEGYWPVTIVKQRDWKIVRAISDKKRFLIIHRHEVDGYNLCRHIDGSTGSCYHDPPSTLLTLFRLLNM